MNFCSNCGSKDLINSIPTGETELRIVCNNCSEIHYINPKIITGCLVVHKNKVLLCRRNIEPRYNLWNLPCGFMEMNESLKNAAIRETLEETEASVAIKHLLCTYSLPKHGQVYVIFYAEMLDGHYATTPESNAVELFDYEAIPWNDLAFNSTAYALKKYFEDARNNTLGQTHHGELGD